MFGITNFRWFSDDRTEAIRQAKAASKEAHEALHEYGDHQLEQNPRGRYETLEYERLNAAAYEAHLAVRDARWGRSSRDEVAGGDEPADDTESTDADTPPAKADTELVKAARDWIRDCSWADLTPEQVAELSDDEILRGIEQHYDGGLAMFEEAGWFDGEEPELPYPVDEDGFPTVHATFQAHTLPDDTYSWGCGKSGCYNGLPEYATKADAAAAALEHEREHGYERPAPLDALEAELDAEPADDAETPGAPDGAEPELEANEQQQLPGPNAKAELAEPELEADDAPDNGVGEAAVEPEPLAVTEPDLAISEPAIDEPELGADEPEVGEPEPEQPSSWLGSAKDWGRSTAGLIRGKITDTVEFAKDWIRELRSGRHKQAIGAWQDGDRECTIQVAKNEFGVSLDEINSAYGGRFVDNVLERNDIWQDSFDNIADFIHRTQVKGRDRELEADR